MSDTETQIPKDATTFEADCFKLKAMFDSVDEGNALALLLTSASINFELERGGDAREKLNGRIFQIMANNTPPLKRLVLQVCEDALARQNTVIPEIIPNPSED